MKRRGKQARVPENLEVADLTRDQAARLIERARCGTLSEQDCATIEALLGTVTWLQEELEQRSLTIARLRSLFGIQTSEKTKDVLGEEPAPPGTPASEEGSTETPGEGEETSPPRRKPPGHGRHGADDYTGAERIPVPHPSLKPGDPCPACPKEKPGRVYLQAPRRLIRVVGQAPVRATVYEQETLRCNLCGQLFVAPPPPGVGERKYDETSAAMMGLLKYGSGMPFNRLERLEGNLGIPLPAATQWEILEEAANQLAPIHEELERQGAQAPRVYNDDTSMRVLGLREQIQREQKSGESDRTGIFTTAIVCELAAGQRIALFATGRKHAGENLDQVLEHRDPALPAPIQMCDGLDRNLPKTFKTVLANCLAHGRRKFVELVESFPTECRQVLESLGQVYRHDEEARKRALSAQERLRYHKEKSGPVMDQLQQWMREQFDQRRVEPNSGLGEAISYMLKRWKNLTLFLRRVGAPLDNNLCERALKKAVLHRKNAYFFKTTNGARVADCFMSLIHTAELMDVNAFEYLSGLLRHPDQIRQAPAEWLPWNYAVTLAPPGSPSP